MRIGRSDEAELERVDAELQLVGEAALQRLARVLAGQHVGLLELGTEAAAIPTLEVGELVARREGRMRLAVALGLGRLVYRLPAPPALGVVAVERLLRGQRNVVEHQAVGEVAVVRDREQLAARLLLVG